MSLKDLPGPVIIVKKKKERTMSGLKLRDTRVYEPQGPETIVKKKKKKKDKKKIRKKKEHTISSYESSSSGIETLKSGSPAYQHHFGD